jgi:hypothetical protein
VLGFERYRGLTRFAVYCAFVVATWPWLLDDLVTGKTTAAGFVLRLKQERVLANGVAMEDVERMTL